MPNKQIYKCNVCGNTVELLYVGGGQLVCCGQPMQALDPKSQDEGLEKHLPVVVNQSGKLVVTVGGTPHPMEADHYIVFIEVITKIGQVYRHYLKAGDLPQAEFDIDISRVDKVREYCNIHGPWQVTP